MKFLPFISFLLPVLFLAPGRSGTSQDGFRRETPARPCDERRAEEAMRAEAETTTVILLGTGMPRPDPDASGPATAVVVGKKVFVFDAGPGVERRLAAARLPIAGPTALFITHLHSDHTLGYPDLIFTSWVMGRKTPLRVYGPPGLRKMTDHLLAAWEKDIAVRTEGLEHETPDGYRVDVREIGPGVVYDSGG